MTNLIPGRSIDRAIDTTIALARCSTKHRILLAGAHGPASIINWRSRGYHRVATTSTCKLPRAQYDVAVVEWRQHSIKALATSLDWLVYFLSPRGALVVWIESAIDTPPGRRELRTAVEQLGFCVETGTRAANGFVVSAHRFDIQHTMAA